MILSFYKINTTHHYKGREGKRREEKGREKRREEKRREEKGREGKGREGKGKKIVYLQNLIGCMLNPT